MAAWVHRGPFTVSGGHRFGAFNNARQVTIVILDRGGSTATVTDTVIDPPAGSPDEIYVGQLYHDLLQREADAGGLAYWSSLLVQGASRAQIVSSIMQSGEYRQRQVNDLYHQLLHRDADSAGLSYFTGLLSKGDTLEQVQTMMAGSAEYYQTRGGGSAIGFLSALYQDALGRAPDPVGQAAFLPALAQGTSPGQVAAAIFASTEFKQNLVAGYYSIYLGRPADSTGLQYFVALLGQGHGDEEVLTGILGSDEYFAL